jgi:hypothetical protein
LGGHESAEVVRRKARGTLPSFPPSFLPYLLTSFFS